MRKRDKRGTRLEKGRGKEVYGTEKKSLEHIIKECKEARKAMTIEELLKDGGRGREIMERFHKVRRGQRERRTTTTKPKKQCNLLYNKNVKY